MRIVGWPEEPDADGCILPVTIVDVDFHGTPKELRAIGEFLLKAATELDLANSSNSALHVGVELGSSNLPTTATGHKQTASTLLQPHQICNDLNVRILTGFILATHSGTSRNYFDKTVCHALRRD